MTFALNTALILSDATLVIDWALNIHSVCCDAKEWKSATLKCVGEHCDGLHDCSVRITSLE